MTTLDPIQISRQYQAGAAPSELARIYRCPLADIEAALDATATPRRKRGVNRLGAYRSRAEAMDAIAARNAEIVRLHAAGATTTEIMAVVGLQRGAVCKVLRQANGQRPVATDAEIIALARTGAAINAIIRDLHVSYRRVTRALAAADLRPPAAPDPAERAAEIVRRRRNGEHPTAIAAAMEIGESTVYRTLLGVDDLPPLRQPTPKPPKPAKAPKPRPEPAPEAAKPPRKPPVLLDRPVVPKPPKPPKPKTHITIRGPQRKPDSVDRYIATLLQASAPQRQPEPPCDICGAEHCPTPLICGRHRRARAQHHYQARR